MQANVGGTYRTTDAIKTRVSGNWRDVQEGWVKVSGTWRKFYRSPRFYISTNIGMVYQTGIFGDEWKVRTGAGGSSMEVGTMDNRFLTNALLVRQIRIPGNGAGVPGTNIHVDFDGDVRGLEMEALRYGNIVIPAVAVQGGEYIEAFTTTTYYWNYGAQLPIVTPALIEF